MWGRSVADKVLLKCTAYLKIYNKSYTDIILNKTKNNLVDNVIYGHNKGGIIITELLVWNF
jgi:hypothetical protein